MQRLPVNGFLATLVSTITILSLASPGEIVADAAGDAKREAPKKAPKDARKRPDDPDLARIRVFVDDLKKPRNTRKEQGLVVSTAFIPDLLAFEVGRRYVDARDAGLGEREAIDRVIDEMKKRKGKDLAKRSGLRIRLENHDYDLAGAEREHVRIFTYQGKFPGGGVRFVGLSRRSTESRKVGRPLRGSLLEKPRNFRSAKVRVKKFWKLRKRGARPRRIDPSDPDSRFKDPILSDPIAVRLIEKKPVEFTLKVSKPAADKYTRFELRIKGLKKFEGPFRGDLIDLNAERRWDPIKPLVLPVELPPAGREVPDALLLLTRRIERQL